MRPPHDQLGLLACTSLVLACIAACSAPDERPTRTPDDPRAPAAETSVAAAIEEEDDEEPVRDGKYLYTRNCAGCHNDNGDGLGPTIVQMGLKARSFAEGHFAFGNTRESIFRTIASGVPGRSPMPGFAMVLDEDERWLIVDYVRTLMPKEEEVDESLSVMHVKDEPVIVRGMLRPIVEGAPEWPRGLLVGLPEGFTFAYRADDVRLIGVYQGEFVDRRDWYDRGGSKLKVLGQPVYVAGEEQKARPASIDVSRTKDAEWTATVARLVSTSTHGDKATVVYALSTPDGETTTVTEVPGTKLLAQGPAFARSLSVKGARAVRLPIGLSVEQRADAHFNGTVHDVRKDDGTRHVSIAAQSVDAQLAWTVVIGDDASLDVGDGGWYCTIRPKHGEAHVTTIAWMSPASFTLAQLEALLPEVLQ